LIDKTLFDALQAFFQEHQYCGELDGGVEGDCVWMSVRAGQRSTETRAVTDQRGPRGAALVHVVTFS
jgi:hypothetical protein